MAQTGPLDAQNGRALAERLCATCHAVVPDVAGGRPDVPSFAAIARMPHMTPERLAGAIVLPHPAMPGVALTRAELRDVIAYITSLKPPN
jgi:cytochrome c